MTDQEKKVAAFIYRVRKKLTGDQLDECLQMAGPYSCSTHFDTCDYYMARELLDGRHDAHPNWTGDEDA